MKIELKNKGIGEPYLENLLTARGIKDINEFLYPKEANLINESLLDNIHAAALLLLKHINNRILLIVDCDGDGYTSAAILWQYIKRINPDCNITYWIHEGKQHGLEDFYNNISKEDFDLVLLPDASSNDFDLHKELFNKGIEILIIDHHEAPKYSEYATIVNNQLSTNYPNKNLSAAGVVYKFCKYFDKFQKLNYADDYLDLAAIGIIGDVMNITPLENRYIIKAGLRNIENNFIKTIIEVQAFSIKDRNNITPGDIAWYITPLINALIRVGTLKQKEDMFCAFLQGNKIVPSTKRGAGGELESLATQVARNCVNARSRQNRTKEKAIELIDMQIFNENLANNKIIIVEITKEDNIDSTLTGLIAMELTKKYKKPVIIAKVNDEGFLRGSARGDARNELKDLKKFFQDSGFFQYAEGHPFAHGISIKKDQISNFINYANEKLKDVDFNEASFEVDFLLDYEDNNLEDIILEIGKYPNLWGQGNPEPLIAIINIPIMRHKYMVIGNKNDTIKIEQNGISFIQFRAKKLIEELENKGDCVINIVGKANINEWAGHSTPQITIDSYEIKDNFWNF